MKSCHEEAGKALLGTPRFAGELPFARALAVFLCNHRAMELADPAMILTCCPDFSA